MKSVKAVCSLFHCKADAGRRFLGWHLRWGRKEGLFSGASWENAAALIGNYKLLVKQDRGGCKFCLHLCFVERGSKVLRLKQIILNNNMFKGRTFSFLTAKLNQILLSISHHQGGRLCTDMSNRLSSAESIRQRQNDSSPALSTHFFQHLATSLLQLLPNSS